MVSLRWRVGLTTTTLITMATKPGAPRIAALAGLVTIPLTTACGGTSDGSGAAGSGLAAVSYIGVQEQGSSGYAAAEIEGFFKQEGLKFSPTWATTGSVILQGLVSGDFDVANLGPAQLYVAIENGACARVLRPTAGAAYGLIAQPSLHLDTTMPYPEVLTQLQDKAVGVPARGAAQELVLRSLLQDAGLDPDTDVTWVAIGSGATATTAFSSGNVDASMSYSQLEVNLHANGTSFDKLLDLSGSDTPLGDFWQSVAVANCDWADDHPDAVLKFCHALNQGFSALAEDHAAGPRAFAYLNIGSDLDQATSLWEKYKTPSIDIPAFNEQNWSHQARFTPDGYTPDFSEYVVKGCATA